MLRPLKPKRRSARSILVMALQSAIIERDGMADAYPAGSPERASAEKWAAIFRDYLSRRFGEEPWDRSIRRLAGEAVSGLALVNAPDRDFEPGKE